MALIKCKECGKEISDTTELCIHCGAPTEISLSDKKKEEKKAEKIKEDKDHGLTDFLDLKKSQQAELEREFWKTDKSARKHAMRSRTCVFLACIAFISFLTSLASVLLGNPDILNLTIKNPVIHRLLFFEFDGTYAPFVFAVCVLSLIGAFASGCGNKKTALYCKKFQKWLRSEKKIKYTPKLFNDFQKQAWDKVNLNDKNKK